MVWQKHFHEKFVSASGDSLAALSRNEAKYVDVATPILSGGTTLTAIACPIFSTLP
jgi:hypothetical protein